MQCSVCQQEMPETGQCLQCGDAARTPATEQATPLLEVPAAEAGSGAAVSTAARPQSASASSSASDRGAAAETDGQPSASSSRNGPESKAPLKPPEEAAAPKVSAKNFFKSSRIGQVVNTEGKVAFVANNIYYQEANPQERRSQQENSEAAGRPPENKKSLSGLITELPLFSAEIPASISEDRVGYSRCLQEERLLLLSCLDEKLALTAAHALIQPESWEKLQLNIVEAADDGPRPSIYRLIEELTEVYEEGADPAVILVDTYNPLTLPFLDSLVGATVSHFGIIKEQLKSLNLWLIGIADSVEIDKKLSEKARDLASARWHLPFLRPLLQLHYADRWSALESQLQRQQQEGKWSRDERELYQETKALIRGRSLHEELAKRETPAEPVATDSLIKDGAPVEETVLYVATYFPELGMGDFNRVVSLLLGERTTMVAVKAREKTKDGGTEIVEREEEKKLIELWRNSPPDKKIRDCGLAPSKDSPKVMTFADYRVKEAVKLRLETEYSLSLIDRFHDVQQLGLLFDASEKVAGNAIKLHLEMLTSDPEAYGAGWIAEFVQRIDTGFELQRVTRLIHGMLERPELAPSVERCFNHLMMVRRHGLMLELVKGLRSARGFKDFHWLKRLFNEADETVRQRAYAYLYAEAGRMGFSIYELLQAIESWLPGDEAVTHSKSERYAMRLLTEYCLETTSRFKMHLYGLWPPRYPLLAAQHERQNLSRLIRWLFHPRLDCAFDDGTSKDDLDRVLGLLLAEWFFIIKGQPEAGRRKDQNEEAGRAADDLVRFMLEEIIAQTMAPTRQGAQRALIACWEEFMEFLLLYNQAIGDTDRKLSNELSWKRNLLYRVLKQFRASQKQYRSASRPGQPESAGRS